MSKAGDDNSKLFELDLYDILGVDPSASVKEVKKAYRQKALTCHPDKNPDNPKAAELFLQLSKALEILIDDSARAAYDRVLKAKQAAKLRHRELDARRKKFKEELEERERAAAEASSKYKHYERKSAEEKLAEEIERLRKEGSKQVAEEMEYVKNQILLEKQGGNTQNHIDPSEYRLKLRWQSNKMDENNGGYNSENLNRIFSKYGAISAIVISTKKKGSALIEFTDIDSAVKAQKLEIGLPENPLKIDWLNGKPSTLTEEVNYFNLIPQSRCTADLNKSQRSSLFPSFAGKNLSSGKPTTFYSAQSTLDADFESAVLQKLRDAEEKKRQWSTNEAS